MDAFLKDYPFAAAWALLFVVGLLRGQGTYWLGRGASGAATRAGRTVVHRAGLVAVPLCYLTVGLQTAILVAAGLVRIPWLRFTIAQLPGVAAWATIYSTIGFAGWSAAIAAFTGTGWGWALLAILIAVCVVLIVRRIGRRALRSAENDEDAHAPQ
ncbi:MAG: DedA family protein [Candidatus Microbacterium stercoravium]